MSRFAVVEHNQEEMYELLRDRDGVYFLEIVCGGIGVYSRFLRLTDDEILAFQQQGSSSLIYLIGRWRQNPQIFSPRELNSLPT